MAAGDDVVIIGAGQAGGRAAEALRRGGHTGSITIVGDELHPPYERPSLSKGFLHEPDLAKLVWVRPHAWYASNNVALLTGRRVTNIHRARRQIELEDGTAIDYQTIVIATGTRPRLLPVSGADHPAVRYLRTIEDSRELRKRIRPGGRVVVIGAGFIGLEVAAMAKTLGGNVTVLEWGALPMGRAVPPKVGAFYAAFHRAKGVDLRLGARLQRIVERNGHTAVEMENGELLPADVIVVGIGATPNVDLAENAGLVIDNGIVVDEYGRTSDPAIYAAGDVTSHFNPLLGHSIRLESWQNAQNQAIAVARNVLGEARAYAEVPWFWTDQFELNLQIAGLPKEGDDVIQRGSLGEGPAVMFHMRDDNLVAVIGIDSPKEVRFGKEIIAMGGRIDRAALTDPAVNLANVVRAMKQASKVT
jgi:NADPH-dependent 2,4-dienoyl-CoA reductase/sulfur reductase-like enzyme